MGKLLRIPKQNLLELGELLRNIRLRHLYKRQVDLASLLNIDPSTVSRHEKGKALSKPYLMRFIEALKLSHIEAIRILGLAGEVPPTYLPYHWQIEDLLLRYSQEIMSYPYPALIVDHCFGIWCMNKHSLDILTPDRSRKIILSAPYRTIFELLHGDNVLYDKERDVGDVVSSPEERMTIIKAQIQLFKLFNVYRQHEDFYRLYTERGWMGLGVDVAANNPFKYQQFKAMWNQIDIYQDGKTQVRDLAVEYEALLPNVKNEKNESVRVAYRQSLQIVHLLGMFAILHFVPLNEADLKYFKSNGTQSLMLWELGQKKVAMVIDSVNQFNGIAPTN